MWKFQKRFVNQWNDTKPTGNKILNTSLLHKSKASYGNFHEGYNYQN